MNEAPPRKLVVLTDNNVHPDAAERLRARANIRVPKAYPSETTLVNACRQAVCTKCARGATIAG